MKDKFAQRIKRILVKQEAVDEQKAEGALATALKDDKSYVDVLLDTNLIDEENFIGCVASETGFAPVDVQKLEYDESALSSITEEMATHYCVIPVSKIGNILTIAVGNPFDILLMDELRSRTNCDIRPVISTERSIRRVLPKAYNPEEAKMEEIIDSAAGLDDNIELKETDIEEDLDLSALADASGESPVIRLVNMIVIRALKEGASDIHIEPFEKAIRVRYREDGVLKPTMAPPKSMLNSMISRIKIMSNLDIAERRIPQDGKFQVKFEGRQIDFRVSILPTIHGEKAVLRVLDSGSLNLGISNLGFEPQAEEAFRRAVAASYGMILVTGPTGSGKSTTLYASLREVLNVEDNVVTVEDPVEYQLDGVVQVPVSVKRGMTFAAALRSILRQDPDIIMIGEIRDFETADIAVKAAITGHLVLSTLHTNDAASAITRLVDMGIDPFMVASSVLLVAAQRLLRKLCDRCKKQDESMPPEKDLLSMGFKPEHIPTLKLYRPVGCPACTNGYRGRFAILEALEVNEDLRRIIIEGKSAIDIKHMALNKCGMITLRQCALLNASRGKTSLEEVLRMTMID